jgi:hypothetical protein
MHRPALQNILNSAAIITLLAGCPTADELDDTPVITDGAFVRADPLAESPSGHLMIDECSADQQTWDEATATIHVEQTLEGTRVDIAIVAARPDTLFTAWLRLRGTDPETGETFGGNPITDKGSTPLAPTSELIDLIALSETVGGTEAANVLTTDGNGTAEYSVDLDFAMIGGAYPFDLHDGSFEPVNIVGAPLAPFMIRLASHCQDGLAHGILQGDREIWFNWSP